MWAFTNGKYMLWPTSSKHFQIHIHYSISSWAGTVETFANNQDVVCLVESWKKFHGIICHSYGKCTRGWWKITHSFFQTSLQLFSLLRIRKLIKVISYFALSPRFRSTYHFLLFPFLHFLQSYFLRNFHAMRLLFLAMNQLCYFNSKMAAQCSSW